MKQVDVMSEDECSFQCVMDEGCFSYNFGITKRQQETSCVNYAIPTDLLVLIISQKMTILGIEEHR